MLCVSTIVGVVLRSLYLSQPIRFDEAATYLDYTRKPFFYIVSTYKEPNNHVLHTLLVRLCYLALGGDEWVIRLPAFIFGSLSILLAYTLARSIFSRAAGVVASAMVATSSTLVEFSTNARGYTLICFLCLALIYFAMRLLDRDRTADWVILAVIGALGCYTVPIFLYPLGGTSIWILVQIVMRHREKWPLLRIPISKYVGFVGLTGLLTAILYLPILHTNGLQALYANRYVSPLPFDTFRSEMLPSLWETLENWIRDCPAIVLALACIGICGLILRGTVASWGYVRLVGCICLFSGVVVIAQRVVPFPRVWLFLLPLIIVAVSGGFVFAIDYICDSLRRPAFRDPCLIAVWCTILIFNGGSLLVHKSVLRTFTTGTFPDAETVARFLYDSGYMAGPVLAMIPSDLPLQYYLAKHGFQWDQWALPLGGAVRSATVVVNRDWAQTVDSVLRARGITAALPDSAKHLIWESPGAAIYAVTIDR